MTSLVAEDGSALADPLPERRCTGEACVCHQAALVQLAGVEADRADEQLAAAVGELLEQPRDRRAAVAGDRFGVAGKPEADCLLGEEHRHTPALLERSGADEK